MIPWQARPSTPPAAHAVYLRLTRLSTLHMKWTMHRWYRASGSITLTVAIRPVYRSPANEPHAPEPAFDQALEEALPTGHVLPHALTATRMLAVSTLPSRMRLSPHAIHKQARVRASQRPVPPFVNLRVHTLELAVKRLRGHPLAPTADGQCINPLRAHTAHDTCRLVSSRRSTPVIDNTS